MNLFDFLEKIKTFTANRSKEELEETLLNIARKVPENRRDDFLDLIKNQPDLSEELLSKDIMQKIEQVKSDLEKINSEELMIYEDINEEYDDWYDMGEDEFIYSDPDLIGDRIIQAFNLVNTLFDIAEYEKCLELTEKLLALSCYKYSDYDSEYLNLSELSEIIKNEYNVSLDLLKLILQGAYSAYLTVPKEKRAETILKIATLLPQNDFSFEKLFQFGSELEDIDSFLDNCISILKESIKEANTIKEEKLLEEALELKRDNNLKIETAFEVLNEEPSLIYHLLLEDKSISDQEKIDLGLKAINLMNKNYKIRSRIALIVADNVLKSDKNEELLNYCYLESLRSDTNATNLLRYLINSTGNFSDILDQAKTIIKEVLENKETENIRSYAYIGIRNYIDLNKIFESDKIYLDFLCGDFLSILKNSVESSKALYYSSSKEVILSLYSFLLYNVKNLPSSFLNQEHSIKSSLKFKDEDYCEGLNIRTTSFLNVLCEWKHLIPLKPDLISRILTDLDKLLENYVTQIMSNNLRELYQECADLIDEVAQAHYAVDKSFNVNEFLNIYKSRYHRRYKFVPLLEKYMI